MQSISDLIKSKDIPIVEMTNKQRLEMQAKFFNDTEGTMDEVECPICKNKGYIQQVAYEKLYGDYVLNMVHCECMRKRETIRKARNSGLGEYLKKRFEDFTIDEDWQKNIRQKALNFIKENNSKWWVIVGQSGCGKTLISSIISNYLLIHEGLDVIYITWTDFISKLKRDIMSDNSESVSQYLERIKNVEVLFVDEMLKKWNETDLKYLIEIINYRYTNDLKTIITSERELNELLNIDEATFSRMVEKAEGYITIIPKDRSKNYRLRGIK